MTEIVVVTEPGSARRWHRGFCRCTATESSLYEGLSGYPPPEPSFPILGDPDNYMPAPADRMVLALSDPAPKKQWAETYRSRNAPCFSSYSPFQIRRFHVFSGEGLMPVPYNSISRIVRAGDFVAVYGLCKIGHDLSIGSYSHIASHCSLDGFFSLAAETLLPSFSNSEKNQIR
jgi:hypothetical protein